MSGHKYSPYGWTRHGHRIPGLPQTGEPPAVSRCGGPSICQECFYDTRRDALDRMARQQQEEKRAQLVDEWMQVTGLSTKETRDLINKIEERLEK